MERTHSIMFVCHGNICRSPMAEFLLKDMIKKRRACGQVCDCIGRYKQGRNR